jgi:CO/xanthine dehydrogenase Mo-binding subunit
MMSASTPPKTRNGHLPNHFGEYWRRENAGKGGEGRAMTTQRAVGRPVNRVEARDKVTGAATYTADNDVSDVAYAVLVQSEIPHERVTVDSLRAAHRRAVAVSGVSCVLTPLNCPPLHAPPRDMSYDLLLSGARRYPTSPSSMRASTWR